MRTLPLDAGDEEILALVREWSDLLAEERYEEALALVDHRQHWHPDLLRAVVESYGSPEPCRDGSKHRVTRKAVRDDDG